MKTLKWSLLAVLLTGVGVSTAMLRTRSPHALSTDANERDSGLVRPEAVIDQFSPLPMAPVRKLTPAVPPPAAIRDMPADEIAPESANVRRVRADHVLAKVNDQAILLKDLVPLRTDEQDQSMTLEEYESRLNRAIEMELTFQAAADQGVDLTPDQKKRVNAIRHEHEAALQEYTKQGVTWSSVTQAQVELEQRLTSALLLQQKLVAMVADVAPAPDPAVQGRYEQARSDVLSGLRARGNISVSAEQ
jgi:hypothetical protein